MEKRFRNESAETHQHASIKLNKNCKDPVRMDGSDIKFFVTETR